ncbi:MAG: STAS domain-containing protein [Phenylobacterium sp.]|uniref:STAS domain-containing protein n=1 Tax=Phenylobacterium sp. TaxID=1871053 RepID=UPI001A4C2A8C|nr:STAS domain-containing protein [Phenylobacterium sp.]MBL8556503.1 STAS domain-containing protein [Phenylobacterium sp.]
MGWRKLSGAGHAVVEVEGCLDSANCPEFQAFLADAAADAAARDEQLEIDLTHLREISSHGLRALACAQHEARRIVLTCPAGRVREILTISRLDSVFRVRAPAIHFVGPSGSVPDLPTSGPVSLSPAGPAPVRAAEA